MKSNAKNLCLGDIAKDTITGFEGVVVAITEWLNGCLRITIQPQAMKDGKPIGHETFDIEQVELVSPKEPPKAKPSGGPKPEPARLADLV